MPIHYGMQQGRQTDRTTIAAIHLLYACCCHILKSICLLYFMMACYQTVLCVSLTLLSYALHEVLIGYNSIRRLAETLP